MRTTLKRTLRTSGSPDTWLDQCATSTPAPETQGFIAAHKRLLGLGSLVCGGGLVAGGWLAFGLFVIVTAVLIAGGVLLSFSRTTTRPERKE
jgi:hypothetical protein